MATSSQVLGMLIPNGGYIQVGSEYEGIEFLECDPITKAQFEAGFAQYDAWKANEEAQKQALIDSKNAKLLALGFTLEELSA